MRNKLLLLTALLVVLSGELLAQEKQQLSLEEAVELALKNSDEAKISEAKLSTASNQLKVTRNNQYPDLKVSGQYNYLTNANVDLQLQTGNSSGENTDSQPAESPKVNQLLLGQVNMSLPIFSGFKLKNAVEAEENNLEAAKFNALNDKEKIALQTITDYLNLYKARKSITLIEENLKGAHQRVKDFTAMEKNGLLARNDLLKAQIQESNIRLSLEEAKKNEKILNYKLAVSLKLPEDSIIETNDEAFLLNEDQKPGEDISRNDLQALEYRQKAAENGIKAAKSSYFPSIALVGGYTALDLKNAITVSNAMNFGVGISYNLADIFKTKSEVKLAESKAQELEHTVDMVKDKVKVQVENARQDYELALRKLEVYTESREQAVENYRIVSDKYDNGLMDTKDLLDADFEQLQAKINLTYARANITQKYYELQSAQGTLTNKFKK